MSQVFDEKVVIEESKGGAWNSIFFVLAGAISFLVMEIIEGNLRRFLFLSFLTTLFFIIFALWLLRNRKISRETYISTFSVPAAFISFIFLTIFWINPIGRQVGIIFFSLFIMAIPYLAKVFVVESLSFGLFAFTIFRLRVILEASVFFLLAMYLLIAWGLITLAYAKFKETKEKISIGFPSVFIVLVELFLVFLILPINLSSRGILMGASFYFIFEFISLKSGQALTTRLILRNIIMLAATYLLILMSAHWV